MTQPEYVPVLEADKVRDGKKLPPHGGWRADRPGDLGGGQPTGARLGNTGPDAGYGLKLIKSFQDRLELAKGEHAADAIAGCFGVGSKRAALFGRAPVIYDYELALTLYGFLGGAPADLIAFRQPLFQSCAHHYFEARDLCDRVPESTLRMTPAQVRAKLGGWKQLIAV